MVTSGLTAATAESRHDRKLLHAHLLGLVRLLVLRADLQRLGWPEVLVTELVSLNGTMPPALRKVALAMCSPLKAASSSHRLYACFTGMHQCFSFATPLRTDMYARSIPSSAPNTPTSSGCSLCVHDGGKHLSRMLFSRSSWMAGRLWCTSLPSREAPSSLAHMCNEVLADFVPRSLVRQSLSSRITSATAAFQESSVITRVFAFTRAPRTT